jgi:hypothetical protein
MARPLPNDQLLWAADLALTQNILGTIDFVVNTARPDVAFAYNAVARYANTNAFTPLVLKYARRVARYLLATIELHLTVHSPTRTRLPSGGLGLNPLYADVDSSHANGEGGRSYGVFVLFNTAEGGANARKSILTREPVDSTGAAELRPCTHTLKYIVVISMLQSELNLEVAPTGPTIFATDAAAVVNGAALERVTRMPRWQATRCGMARWSIEARSIDLTKKGARLMVADILTIPREPVDSTGAAELRLCTHALKYVVAICMLQSELNLEVSPTGPTIFATDAAAVVNGVALVRIARTSRWQAYRYGMMRWGDETRSIELIKKDARIMVGDTLTKPLTGAHFNNLTIPQEATPMVRMDPGEGPKEPI